MKFKTIFLFEYLGYLKNKVFLGVTIGFLLIILLFSLSPNIYHIYQNNISPPTNKPLEKAMFLGEREYYTKERLTEYLPQYQWEYGDDLSDAREKIEDGSVKLAVEKLPSALEANIYIKGTELLSPALGLEAGYKAIQTMILEVTRDSILKEIDPEIADKVLEITALNATINTISIGKDSTSSFGIGYGLVMILYMAIILYGQFIMNSVISEKTSKAMELLITSAKPTELMFGKVLGVGGAALTQMGIILVSAFVTLKINQNAWKELSPSMVSMIESSSFSTEIILYFLLFFILGFFLYAFMFAALASTASRMEDASSLSFLPAIVSVISLFIAIYGITDINSLFVKIFSFLPFSSPMVMFMRICVGDVSSMEILVSIIILIAGVYITGFISSKIYRIGLLMYGNRPSLRNIVKMMRKS